ncbi:MAG: hypothetical protein COY66_02630 [Candidatus Kerfeldbacteria bacterium CG_4_10_14_0_8_um_filter_42_10]|uniref:Uncharacterized protein n=1 Tax=Candidatus Kerfeldbacteria bacterium CG_4_10_14_0_8_um_filter_42_10 TaxID=2014248 RepID=A0A2M7RJP2_9BACT|nr:MAG: hypothetical protein COY66_02630 [Candidatus Kerfeldbacteria bacterium CG_4_10_14_0_8_um_filter_42_10]
MKRKNKLLSQSIFSKLSKRAVFCLSLAILSIALSLIINQTFALQWQGPTANPPDSGTVQPPINTSSYNQEKSGGLIIASGADKKVGIGDFSWGGTEPAYELDVIGDVHATGSGLFGGVMEAGATRLSELCIADEGTLCMSGNNILHATGALQLEGNATLNGNLVVDTDTFQVSSGLVYIKSVLDSGLMNIGSVDILDKSAISAMNASDTLAAVYGTGTKTGVYGNSNLGTGIYGSGGPNGYGVWGSSLAGAKGGVVGEGSIVAPGVVGYGYTGIIAVDKNEVNIFMSYASTLAGWFKGDVVIEESSGTSNSGDLTLTNGDLTVAGDMNVDNSTLVVDSVNHRVGIGTVNPEVRLEVAAASNQAGIYASSGTASGNPQQNGPETTIAAIYAHGGNATDSAVNFGVYGKAGTSSGASTTYGIYGYADDSTSSYAGYFKGPVKIDDNGGVPGTLNVKNTATFSNNVTVEGVTTLAGDLQNSGGLYVYDTSGRNCVPPTSKDNGTLYVCKYCDAQIEYTTLYVYLDNEDGNGNNDWIQTAENTKSIAPNNCGS